MKHLLIFLLIPCFSFSQAKDSSLTASPAEQLMFSLNFRTMNYWYAEAMVQRRELAIQDTIIQLYERQTGVYKNNIKAMEENFALKNDINRACLPQLDKCNTDLSVFKPKCRRRGWIIAGGIPVAIGVGFIAGAVYQSVK